LGLTNLVQSVRKDEKTPTLVGGRRIYRISRTILWIVCYLQPPKSFLVVFVCASKHITKRGKNNEARKIYDSGGRACLRGFRRWRDKALPIGLAERMEKLGRFEDFGGFQLQLYEGLDGRARDMGGNVRPRKPRGEAYGVRRGHMQQQRFRRDKHG
jgi:hypothetical protein